jgi:glycosyltransferase involved in cell wall biosynthesis
VRIAVYPHDLAVGGSQLNAIELGAAVHRLGHPTLVVGRPGALVDRVTELGLEFVELPAPSKRPSRRVALALRSLLREREIDVVHGYEWPPTLEAVWAAHGRRAAAVSTVMSMAVPPFIPHSVPLLVGTEQIAAAERQRGRVQVQLLEPPVDLASNGPGLAVGAEEFRRRHGGGAGDVLVVMVTRLAHQLKLEGLLTAMTAVARLRSSHPVRLVVVGDGPARAVVQAAAEAANVASGAGTVVLAGELADPRPAYAAADIALGMGGSALRALSFAKPLVVQGEDGFWRTLTPRSVAEFLWAGWYGRGAGSDAGADALVAELEPLLSDVAERLELGRYGRQLVVERFSLEAAALRQLAHYRAALAHSAPPHEVARHEAAAGLRYTRYYLTKRLRRAAGIDQSEDFNARPLRDQIRTGPGQPMRMG